MKIAITGASGGLGVAVTEAALAQGHTVVALDLPGATSPVAAAGVERVEGNTTEYEAVRDAFRGCDAVVQLAALLAPDRAPEPQVHHNNVLTSYNALQAAAVNGITKVCLASSVNAIGGAYSRTPHYDYFPLTEEHPNYSHDPYGLSKWIAEAQAADFARRNPDLSVISLRLHAVVEDPERLRRWRTDPPPLAPKDLWGYTVLEDAVQACLTAVQVDATGSEVIYVVAPTTSSARPTAELAAEYYPLVGVRGDLGGHRGFFDCTKSVQLLGLTPQSLDPQSPDPQSHEETP